MPAPAFEFTTRAAPIVQFGRPERPTGDALWQTGLWGTGHWGKADWEPLIWSDLTCEIHEITVNTGRGSASDRFVPGTAHIVASNVHDVADMIFPRVPGPAYESELVPQPPIQQEETLQAPAAATIVSNGWSFTDDFQRAPPRWVFPPAWATTGVAPTVPFRIVTGPAMEPELHWDPTAAGYVGNGAAQWTGVHDPEGDSEITVTLDQLDWPAAPTAGSPEITVELYLRMNSTDKECDVGRVRFVPVFGGANQVILQMLHIGPTGATVAASSAVTDTSGTGSDGVFGPRTVRFSTTAVPDGLQFRLQVFDVAELFWTGDVALPGTRVGMFMHYAEANIPGTKDPPQITSVEGEDFIDDMTRPLGAGWIYPAPFADRDYGRLIADGGAMRPEQHFANQYWGQYLAGGMAQWSSNFEGDQFIEIELAGLQMPYQHLADIGVELYTHGNRQTMAAQVAEIRYLPSMFDDTIIRYSLWQYGPYGELVDYDPAATGDINLGAVNGAFPEPERWRVESDVSGEQRLYRNGTLLLTTTAPDAETGGRIGLYFYWRVNDSDFIGPSPGFTPPGAGIERVWAGLREPLGTEDLGIWIRIGVDHSTLGNQWFLRGCVDGIVPTYVPERPDAVRIECIDTLGEAGRVRILGDQLPHEFAPATTRIHQILNRAHWPRNLMIIREDETVMSRPSSGKAVDALTHVAESCGGAIWSDPRNGNIVFKGQDWQGEVAGGPAIAVITNTDPEDPAIDAPRVCPTGWERSSRREDMNTRVRYSTVSSQGEEREPLIREWRAPNAESIYGVELYERTLLCTTGDRLNELARRQLRLRHPNQFPRVEAVLLDAATADEALDLMTMANWMIPSKYRCQLRRAGTYVFNRSYLVTGIQHTMSPERWTCRLALDIASAFAETGARWDEAHWGTPGDTWGRSR